VSVTEQKYFRKGFKMRENVQHLLDRDYRSEVVDRVRENGNLFEADGLTIRLADEFGFCYGVDRAVDYAFQTREKFPDRRIFITGDMIHNASMNDRLREMGIEFLSQGFDGRPDEKFDSLTPEDVVLLPAFGAPVDWIKKLREEKECIVVDTTCGSVLSVWKRVSHYAREGFTSIIHGKYYHEETRATASQTTKEGGNSKYLIVRNLEETGSVVDFILGRTGENELKEKLGHGMSPGFDPETDPARQVLGVAEQVSKYSLWSQFGPQQVERMVHGRRGPQFHPQPFLVQQRRKLLIDLVFVDLRHLHAIQHRVQLRQLQLDELVQHVAHDEPAHAVVCLAGLIPALAGGVADTPAGVFRQGIGVSVRRDLHAARLRQIDNPVVRTKPSRYAIPVKRRGRRAKAAPA
jgi:hypothetical protein